MNLLLLLSLLTLGLTTAQSNKLKYMVTIPAVMAYPSIETVCVHITSPDNDATVTVSMKTSIEITNLSVQTYKGDGQLQCVPFNVPAPSDGVQEIVTIVTTVESETEKLSENKSALIRPSNTAIFLQTDRAIFQPGDQILIRGAEFDESMKAKDDNFTLVTLQDSTGNKIKEWQNVKPNRGILELSANLSPKISLGEYRITAEKNNKKADTLITVDEHVPPRMELKLTVPSDLSITENSFGIEMCGKYTYNKPVRGNISGKICRLANIHDGKENICQPIGGQSNVRGCRSMTFDTEEFGFKENGYYDYLQVNAFLEEDGTGEMVNEEKIITITHVIAKVSFPESRSTYKSPIHHCGSVMLTRADGSPIPDDDIEIYVDGVRTNNVYTTDENGVARFSLNTETWTKNVNIQAHYLPRQPIHNTGEAVPYYQDDYMTLISFYTDGKSQLKIRSDSPMLLCRNVMNLFADVSLDASEHTQDFINFDYMIFSSGKIHQTTRVKYNLNPNSGRRGFFSFPVTVNSEMSPAATIFLYASLSEGRLLTDSIKIPVTSCFPNPVSLKFSVSQTLPGSDVNLLISALPYSLCSIRAVDKSIELLKSEDKLPEEMANDYLNTWDKTGYPMELEELQSCPPGTWPDSFDSSEQMDTYKYLENAGIKVMTNYYIRKPLTCVTPQNDSEHIMVDFMQLMESFESANNLPEEMRKDFPATWVMQSVLIGPSGQLDYPMKTPDSITQWNVDGICSSHDGLGFSPKTHIEVFRPFFITVITPYSVKQGETMMLVGNVFNYQRQCIKVKATLFESEKFQLEPCENCLYTACLCDDPFYAFTWSITFIKPGFATIIVRTEVLDTTDLCDGQETILPDQGRSDTVQKRLLVEAHGIPVENTRSMLLCAFDTKEVLLTLPENIVTGSLSAELTVTGDITGKALNNLENLVKMPTGCGEQNMIILAPTTAVVKYMAGTGLLTDEILDKAIPYMDTGYQNQLKYKHDDGSFSAFGKGDPSGSTWLTAFTIKFLFLGSEYMYVDMKHIHEGLAWLKGLQQEDGCFRNMGSLVHQELQGGQDSQISLTAYTLQTFLEVGDPQYDDVINKAKMCLEKCLTTESSTYTKALCAHTFTLIGDTEKRKQLLEQLDSVAIKKENEAHWTTSSAPTHNTPEPSKATTGDVETTSYVLLALVSEKEPSKEDLGAAVPIVQWLTEQQTSSGGMQSTQDTVVALSALFTYGMHTFTSGSNPFVNITNEKGFHATVPVEEDKLTAVHEVELPHIPAIYTLEVSRAGCAYVQIIERFNLETVDSDGTFSLSAITTPIHCPPHPVPSFSISLNASYNNEDKYSNMAIVIVKMISCVVPVKESVNKLLSMDVVKRVESSPSEVVIYLDQVGPIPIPLNFQAQQNCIVKDKKPAMIRLMDYYETSHHIEVSYNAPWN